MPTGRFLCRLFPSLQRKCGGQSSDCRSAPSVLLVSQCPALQCPGDTGKKSKWKTGSDMARLNL